MVRLYTAATPNGRKVSIALEELEVPYEWQWTKLDAGDQNRPECLAMNPNAKIPVLDDEGIIVWESGAILLHLAEKHAGLLPSEPAARAETLAYAFFSRRPTSAPTSGV